MIRSVVIGVGLVVPLLTLLNGCGTSFSPSDEVQFLNSSGETIHLFGPSESFGPDNRLEPGQSRWYYLYNASGAEHFYAGRNGEVLYSKECNTQTAGTIVVTFTGTGIVCSSGGY